MWWLAAMQTVGALGGALGARDAAAAQRRAIQGQAQADRISANSTALAMTGQADLDTVNAQASYNAAITSADFANISARKQAFDIEAGAAIGAVRASTQVASLKAGVQIDEQQAMFAELQAQSIMLRGEQKEQDSRMQFAQAKSKSTTSMAARGLDLGQGAPLAVRAGYDLMSENTAIRIQQTVLLDAFGQRVSVDSHRLSAAGKRAQASGIASSSAMETESARINADFTRATALANLTASQTLAAAGLLNATAAVDYKKTMAGVIKDNAMAAALVKQAMGEAISPSSAFASSLLNSAPKVADSWYQYGKQAGKSN